MAGKRQIEARWGLEFWRLVEDFADQGLPRCDVAKALGYTRDGFYALLTANPSRDPFGGSNIVAAYIRDSGEGFREALERMKAEGRSWGYAAKMIGYCDGSRLKRAAQMRGVMVELRGKPGRPRLAHVKPISVSDFTTGWPSWGKVYAMGEKKCQNK
jgi:hypothetical protein